MKLPQYERIKVKASADFGHFGKPESQIEASTYPVITPTASVGLISATSWHPGQQVQVRKVSILNPIKYAREVVTQTLCPSEERTMRSFELVVKPSFLIEIDIVVDPSIQGYEREKEVGKRIGILRRRLKRGKHYKQPYMGISDFLATLELVEEKDGLPAVQTDINLKIGPMPLYWQWMSISKPEGKPFVRRTTAMKKDRPLTLVSGKPKMFDAEIINGVMTIPDDAYPAWGVNGYSV